MSFKSLSLKTDFEKIEHLFSMFFKKEPQWAQTAEADLAYISPVVIKVSTLLGGPIVGAEAAAVLESIQMNLVLATKFIQVLDYINSTGVLNSAIANLNGFLTFELVKTHAAFKEVEAYVNSMVAELQKILETMPK